MRARAYFWCILISALLWVSSTLAGDIPLQQDSKFPFKIKADTLSYDEVTQTYSAEGHVTVSRGEQSLSADAVYLNVSTMEAVAVGNVQFTSGEGWLTGSRLEIDLDDGIGTLHNGSLFIEEKHFYIHGDKIEKVGENSYSVAEGRFTSCDGDTPSWQIRAKELDVTVGDTGKIKHGTVWARSVPVFYTPFLMFPVKRKRQTGFLLPQFSHSNNKGYEFSLPFYWAINESSDLTLYGDYMSDRGFRPGIEYRYALSPRSEGAIMFDYLHDQKTDDGTGFVGIEGDEFNRTNEDRWWLRTKMNQDLPFGFRGMLDLDVVSDQDYLLEFKTGYSSYEDSNDYFEKNFGRDLDDRRDAVRRNQLHLNRPWEQFSLNADLLYFDNVILRRSNEPDPTLQRLPNIQFNGIKQDLFGSPLFFDLVSSYVYFWRDYGTRSHRADLYPRFYYPLTLFKFLEFEPSCGLRQTVYQVEKYQDDSQKDRDNFFTRQGADLKLDLSTDVTKVFNFSRRSVDRVKHTIRPQVVYDYVTLSSQEDLPEFEDIDRLPDINLITYSITNFFSARLIEDQNADGEPESTEEQAPPSYRYNDFCRIKFSQSYDIKEARRDSERNPEPFSDIIGEIELRPLSCLNLDGDVAWSPYDHQVTRGDAKVTLCDLRGDHASIDYVYNKDRNQSIITRFLVKLFDPLWADVRHEHNIKAGKAVETSLGLKYAPPCWSIAVKYTNDRQTDEKEIFFEIGLRGLGEFGL
jgi:LPS-assembly protein